MHKYKRAVRRWCDDDDDDDDDDKDDDDDDDDDAMMMMIMMMMKCSCRDTEAFSSSGVRSNTGREACNRQSGRSLDHHLQ